MTILSIGRHSYIGGYANTEASITIGHYTSIAPYVQMFDRVQHACIAHPELVSSCAGQIPGYPPGESKQEITIGSDVWIGRNVVILGGVTIGDGAIVGAFSVVAKSIPPYAVAVGNPAQVIRFRFDNPTIAALLQIRWWDWPDEVIKERAADLRDVRLLIAKYGYGAGDA